MKSLPLALVVLVVAALPACRSNAPATSVRASGNVEATEVQIAPEIGGRLVNLTVDEGDRVTAGATIATIDDTDTQLALRRAMAERDRAQAQLALLEAGSRAEDIRQAQAQVRAAEAEVGGARDDLSHAEADLARFETLLASNSGSRKQRDDAATRRECLEGEAGGCRGARAGGARGRGAAARGARPQEIARRPCARCVGGCADRHARAERPPRRRLLPTWAASSRRSSPTSAR